MLYYYFLITYNCVFLCIFIIFIFNITWFCIFILSFDILYYYCNLLSYGCSLLSYIIFLFHLSLLILLCKISFTSIFIAHSVFFLLYYFFFFTDYSIKLHFYISIFIITNWSFPCYIGLIVSVLAVSVSFYSLII